ncbi:MAG: hypothetical protein H6773_00645 [Pseudomonadales bacterium]|nr:hypothetical protein [Candidatus Woesebacteria bacterium]MCB9800670.1 hypothetical protein [Pseudomonadales bacterium]
MQKIFPLWKMFVSLLSVVLLFHFIKDITQDVLGITTPLDTIGNIVEDTLTLPEWLIYIYHWGWINAIFFQLLIPYIHIRNWKRKTFIKQDKYILLMLVWILSMIAWALLLTP